MQFNVTIEGRIVKRNPEMFVTEEGKTGARFQLVYSDRYRDAKGQWQETKAQFFDVIAWGALGERVMGSFKCKDLVSVNASAIRSHAVDKLAYTQLTAASVGLSIRFNPIDRVSVELTAVVTTADGETTTANQFAAVNAPF